MTVRVEKFQYREYRFKEFTPRWKRVISTAWVNFLFQWKRSTGVKIIFIIVAILEFLFVWTMINIISVLARESPTGVTPSQVRFFLVNAFLPLNTMLGGVKAIDQSLGSDMFAFSFPLGLFTVLALTWLGAGLFSDDNQYRVVELYLTKMDRLDYIISKYIALLIPSFLILVLPPLITTAFAVTSFSGFTVFDVIWLLLVQLLYQLGISIFITSVILLASAHSSRRAYAGLLVFFVLFFLSFSTSRALSSQGFLLTTTISDVEWIILIDPFLSLQSWGAFLFGYDKIALTAFKQDQVLSLNDGIGYEWWHGVLMLLVIIVLSWILTFRRMLKVLEEVAY